MAAIPVGASTTYFLRMIANILQKSRLAGPCFPCQENRLASVGDQLQGILKLLIVRV